MSTRKMAIKFDLTRDDGTISNLLKDGADTVKKRTFEPIVVQQTEEEHKFRCKTKEQADRMEEILVRNEIEYKREKNGFRAKIWELDDLYDTVVPLRDIYEPTGEKAPNFKLADWIREKYDVDIFSTDITAVKAEFGIPQTVYSGKRGCTQAKRRMIVNAMVNFGMLKNTLY